MKTFFTTSLLLLTLMVTSQTKHNKADAFFEQMRYIDAAKEYEKAFDDGDRSLELAQQAGDSYYFNSDMVNATKWYNRLFTEHKIDSIESRYAFRFIHALKGVGKYKKAKIMIDNFADSEIINPIQVAQLKKDNIEEVDMLIAMEPAFEVFHQNSVNSKYSDFSPMYYKNEIIFSSSRDSMDLETREYHWNKQSFLDLYIAKQKLDHGQLTNNGFEATETNNRLKLENIRKFSNVLNTRYHEASVSFSPDEKTIYFTRNNYTNREKGKLKRGEDGINHLKLYRAQYRQTENQKNQDSIWSNIIELPFNNDAYSVGHPAVSPDGETLYFVSDMPGGYGATDIYKVKINTDGSFGTPTNLGAIINTAGREMYPYVSQSKFYFSSDGHLGLGALDVFQTIVGENDEFNVPINLGAPINSKLDDFGLILDEETQTGYFSSNRKGGKGDDDIYSFVRVKEIVVKKEEVCVQTANGSVIDKINKKPIANADVVLRNIDGIILESVKTDTNGLFNFSTPLDCEIDYTVDASKKKYGEATKSFKTSTEIGLELGLKLESDPIIDIIYVDRGIKKFRIENLNFDLNKDNIRPDAAQELDRIVAVMTEYPSIVIKIEAHTDSRGSDTYNESLSDRRAKSTGNYLVSRGIEANRIESAIGYGEKRLLNECKNGVKCSKSKHDENRRSEFIITKM